jgi:inositol polyphosphate 1-phosphatase
MGWVKLYVTLKSSTYKWDSCAGHAILLALGGKCFEATKAMESSVSSSSWSQLQYSTPRPSCEGIERWCNEGGVVAFRGQDNLSHAEAAVQLVKEAAAVKQTSSM